MRGLATGLGFDRDDRGGGCRGDALTLTASSERVGVSDGVRSGREDSFSVGAVLHRGDGDVAGGFAHHDEGGVLHAARARHVGGPSGGRQARLRVEVEHVDPVVDGDAHHPAHPGHELDATRGFDVVRGGEQRLHAVAADDLHPRVHPHREQSLHGLVRDARRGVRPSVLGDDSRAHVQGAEGLGEVVHVGHRVQGLGDRLVELGELEHGAYRGRRRAPAAVRARPLRARESWSSISVVTSTRRDIRKNRGEN